LAEVSVAVAAERGRKAKASRLAHCLRTLPPDEAGLAALWLTGETVQGKAGIGPAQIKAVLQTPPAERPALTVGETDRRLTEIANIAGSGAQVRRRQSLGYLFAAASQSEQTFLARLLLGELRQGALAGLMLEALALAAEVPPGSVRRAHMLSGDLPLVARAALTRGTAGLASIRLRLFHPIEPMLAQPAEDLADALTRLGRPALELKLDGARVQVHKQQEEVRVFTRQGNEVTSSVPEIVDAIAILPSPELVLDGEVLAHGPDGSPLPFQVTMRRFGRRLDVELLRREIPVAVRFFDCIQHDGNLMIDAPARDRFAELAEAVPAGLLIPRLVTEEPGEAEAFLESALAAGHEGIMAKSLDAPYDAGGRRGNWLKVKPSHTLDLVVLAAEWGSGRRRGRLSNLHLGARAPGGGFVMLGKTFKGLTDAMLAWQTQRLKELAVADEGQVLLVRPDLVVEIAFNELQESPRYPAGLALRFARVKRFRTDKRPAEADSIETVRTLFERQASYLNRTRTA